MTAAAAQFVTIGQGRSIHAARYYTSQDGTQILAAACDRTGFARRERGRKVRPAQASAVTCKACLRSITPEGN